jgi:dTDP-glucose pyrophosphorylase
VEEFLGLLFAGGRGTRLGLITQYISKAFVPVYDRPAFMYPLAQLEASHDIREIVILTNEENDAKLKRLGHRTIIQDDTRVHDMLSGLHYMREMLPTRKHCVLMPCDNVSDILVDQVIETFLSNECDVCFSLTRIADRGKLSQMGAYDPESARALYKPREPPSEWGMIAPYVVSGGFDWRPGQNDADVFNQARTCHLLHHGYWFDIGDPDSLVSCALGLSRLVGGMADMTGNRGHAPQA